MAVKIVMPRLTDTMLQGVISEWLRKEGDEVREGEPLYAVETDKASVEVTSSATGVLLKILVPQGDSVEVGGAVAIIGARGEDYSSLLAPAAPVKPQREEAPRAAAGPSGRVLASPAAKRKAKELNIDLTQVRGTGEGGLITEKDLDAHLSATPTAAPPSAKFGPEERIPLTGIAKAMYERMTLSASIPQVTTVAETDATDLIEMSKAKGISVTTFIVRAVVEGLKRFPQVNSSLDGRTVVRKGYFNIGVSVATPRGLIVPVLHNAEGKDISSARRGTEGARGEGTGGQTEPGGHLRGDLYDYQLRGVRIALLHAADQRPGERHPGDGQNHEAAGGAGRPDRHPVDDLPLAHLRPSPHRRRDGGHLPAGGEKGPAGPRKTLIGDTADQPGAEFRLFNGCNPVQSGGRIHGKCGSFET